MSLTAPDRTVPDADAGMVDIVVEWDAGLTSLDPLDFPGYAGDRTGVEAVRTGVGYVGDVTCVVVESDYSVFGGSMGLVVGEKVARAFRRAAAERLPVVATVRTGGARMQEGMLSLVQMPRVVAAIGAHAASGAISVGLLRSPTTGGVFASWASLLDLRAAETAATIGFAGPRVVETMTGEYPPAHSHTAESAYDAGLVDAVLAPGEVSQWLHGVLGGEEDALDVPTGRPGLDGRGYSPSVPGSSATDRVRDITRPSGLEWAGVLCDSWSEIKGSDSSVRAGLATVGGVRCVVIAMDRHAFGDGCARQGPEAYRLAQRAVELADKVSVPVLTLVDTPGADPSPSSEAGGIAREIARTLRRFDELSTASVSLCVGEGGSGGAIALAHTDLFLMLEDAVFSVIGPEAASVILWHDASRASEATSALRIDARSLLDLGVCDRVVPFDVTARSVDEVRSAVATALLEATPGDRHGRTDAATERWFVVDSPHFDEGAANEAPRRSP